MKQLAALALVFALAACGGRQTLQPGEGASLPPKPAAARTAPTAAQLMTADDQARPERNDELLKRSEQRRDDHFDLPPPG